MLTESQLAALEKAKSEKEAHGEFESECPGYCGAQDTFYVGNMKGVGRIYQQTFIDTYAKVAFAKLYDRKTPITAADLLNDRVVPFYDAHEVKLCRVLTDRGTEYCGNPEHHQYELYLALEDVDHSRTKTKSPQTNGIVERFHKTALDEFYRVAFRKKIYGSIAELQDDLDSWVQRYNDERPHQGRWCFGKTPMRTSFKQPRHPDKADRLLERQLFGRAGVRQGQRRRVQPDWAALARELKRPGVTMTIFWEEYREPELHRRRRSRQRHSRRCNHLEHRAKHPSVGQTENLCHENSLSCTGITWPASGGLNRGFEGDAIAEAFEAAFEIGDGSGLADLVEIRFAELAIGQAFGEHVIGGDEDFVSDGERRAQGAAAALEAVELVLEIAALGSRRGDRGADPDGAEVDVALPGPAALLPAGTLMIAGTDAGPGRQV